MNPFVVIVGDSGSGKSSTFRNLPPEKTVVINTEAKPLPFRSFTRFKNINARKYKDFRKVLKQLKEDKKYEYVILDSFTSLTEIVGKYTDSVYSGFEQWKQYNELITEAIWDLKDLPHKVFVTAIPEYQETQFGESKGYARVKGKELKYGYLEKESSIVLWTKLVENEDGVIDKYLLEYQPNNKNTAKAPDGMFDGELPNDAVIVMQKIEEYYNDSTGEA